MAASQSLGWMGLIGKILHRRRIATGPRLLGAALGLLSCLAAPAALAQQDTNVYVVRQVPVDATAANAAEARDKALAEGQQVALRRLLERLTPQAEHGNLPAPPMDEVQNMVLGISLEDEKTSNVRYLAKLTVRFIPDAVRQLLQSNGLPFTDTPAPRTLVVPVYQPSPDAEPVLWGDLNPWWQAWSRRLPSGLVPVEVPLGDLGDITTLDAPAALSRAPDAVAALVERYRADRAVIAHAVRVPAESGDGTATVRVEAMAAEPGDDTTYAATVEVGPDQALAEALSAAVDQIVAQMSDAWKQRNLSVGTASGRLTALVPFDTMAQWLDVRRALDSAAPVTSWTLQALTADRAQIVVNFAGSEERLADALGQHNLSMRLDGGYWVIRPGRPQLAPQMPRLNRPPSGTPSYTRPAQGTVTIQ